MVITFVAPAQKVGRASKTPGSVLNRHNLSKWVSFQSASTVQGFIVETANPKAILFYASLVPQFADPSAGDVALQFLVLGGTFVTLQVAWDIALMFGVRHLRSRVQTLVSARFQRFTNKASGFIFISLGIALLLQERPSTSVR
jgi:threonine/homoserine/homoserine lactone efflux protein